MKCSHLKKDGQMCGSDALPEDEQCWFHSPNRAAERQAARAKGGRERSSVRRIKKSLPAEMGELYDRLAKALEAVEKGDMPTRRAATMATLARAMVAVLDAGQMSEKLERIEQLLIEEGQGRR